MANRPVGFGYTAETNRHLEERYDLEAEQEALDWIRDVLGGAPELDGIEGIEAVQSAFSDGVLLCRLMNSVAPGSIPKIHPSESNSFKKRENICNFLAQAEAYGCKRGDLFQSVCLTDRHQNLRAVIGGIHALGRMAQKNGYSGPALGPKQADPNPRPEFTEQQILHGRVHGIS